MEVAHFASDLGSADQSWSFVFLSHRAIPGQDLSYLDTPSVLFDGIEVYDQVINGAPNVPEFRSLFLFLMHYDLSFMNPVSQE
ncbi:hypothetical protein JOM56_014752 [Amanita muscaria]